MHGSSRNRGIQPDWVIAQLLSFQTEKMLTLLRPNEYLSSVITFSVAHWHFCLHLPAPPKHLKQSSLRLNASFCQHNAAWRKIHPASPPPPKKYNSTLYAKDFAQVGMPYLYANYKLSTSITVERGVSKHAIAFICHPARVAQFLMQSVQS